MAQEQRSSPLRRAPAPNFKRVFHLACRPIARAITNELISAPTQRARRGTQADKPAGRLPGLTQKSSGRDW